MSMNRMTRRDFVSAGAVVSSAAMVKGSVLAPVLEQYDLHRLDSEFGSCPRKLEKFLEYIVQRRAAEGLNRISFKESGPKPVAPGTVFNATPHDMYLAWTASAAYRYSWSRFHRSAILRDRAFLLMDNVVQIRADGNWDDGGLDPYFGFHGLALAVFFWKQTGDVDEKRLKFWTQAVIKAAESALLHLHYGEYEYSPLPGQYANPEMYFLAGLSAAWKLTGDDRYQQEASRALARYDEWLFEGGGVAYILQSAPEHGYQQMAVKSVALYWDLTQDPTALSFLKRMAPYFPNVLHQSGMVTDAEHPQLKHIFGLLINPAAPAILACLLNDGPNRFAADAAVGTMADSVDGLLPSYGKVSFEWYNYQLCTYAATALWLMERHPLPVASDPGPRRVFVDWSFRGVRSHWDEFAAATTTRQMSDSLAGAYIADRHERTVPIDSAMDGVYFEILRDLQQGQPATWKTHYNCTEWSPITNYACIEGIASASSISELLPTYWAEVPRMGDDESRLGQETDWSSIQHWAVWQDYLVGFGALRSHATGGNTGDVARIRWRLSPKDRKLKIIEQSETSLQFQYGRLLASLACLEQKGGGAFKPEDITAAPRLAWTPLLTRPAPWASGDFLNVSTVVRPASAQGTVRTKGLKNGAVALFTEGEGRKLYLWVVNLTRAAQHYLMDVPTGVTIRTYKRNVQMPPVPPGQPAHAGLVGGETAIWVLESARPINEDALLAAVRWDNAGPFRKRG